MNLWVAWAVLWLLSKQAVQTFSCPEQYLILEGWGWLQIPSPALFSVPGEGQDRWCCLGSMIDVAPVRLGWMDLTAQF